MTGLVIFKVGDEYIHLGAIVDYTGGKAAIYGDGTGDYILNITPNGRPFIYKGVTV